MAAAKTWRRGEGPCRDGHIALTSGGDRRDIDRNARNPMVPIFVTPLAGRLACRRAASLLVVALAACAGGPRGVPADVPLPPGGYAPAAAPVLTTAHDWLVENRAVGILLSEPAQPQQLPVVVYVPGLGEARGSGDRWRSAWSAAGLRGGLGPATRRGRERLDIRARARRRLQGARPRALRRRGDAPARGAPARGPGRGDAPLAARRSRLEPHRLEPRGHRRLRPGRLQRTGAAAPRRRRRCGIGAGAVPGRARHRPVHERGAAGARSARRHRRCARAVDRRRCRWRSAGHRRAGRTGRSLSGRARRPRRIRAVDGRPHPREPERQCRARPSRCRAQARAGVERRWRPARPQGRRVGRPAPGRPMRAAPRTASPSRRRTCRSPMPACGCWRRRR